MKSHKDSVNFESFRDGIVYLHNINDDGTTKQEHTAKARFSNRIVGESQYYSAMAAKVKISRRIRIPHYSAINEDTKNVFRAVIDNNEYEITRAQHYLGKRPPVTDLTLNLIRKRG